MRRALAAVLMLVFSFPLIAPALASGPDDSQLPACCRRNGQHHCAMSLVQMQVASGSAVLSETCPFRLLPHPQLMVPHGLMTRPVAMASTLAPGLSAIEGEAEAGYRIARDRSRLKRGPPQAILL